MLDTCQARRADWGHNVAGSFFDPSLALVDLRHQQARFFVKPGLTLRMLAFNTSRPLFRDNPQLRRAVNFAISRRALQFAGPRSSELTDQYLPPVMPGFKDANIYPLERPDLERAKRLAQATRARARPCSTRPTTAGRGGRAARQARAGGDRARGRGAGAAHPHRDAAYVGKLATQGEPWDIALVLWTPNFVDPYAYLNTLLDRQFVGGSNLARFDSSGYDRELRRPRAYRRRRPQPRVRGSRREARARCRAVAALDVLNEVTFVSDRVGCIVLRPALDLTAACLK